MVDEHKDKDFLTSSVLFHEHEFLIGYNEGKLDAEVDNNVYDHKETNKFGFMKGFSISLETNFYKEIAKVSLPEVQNNERIKKKINSVIDAVDKLGSSNNQSIDYDEEVQKIRSTFKILSSSMLVNNFSKVKDESQKKSW